MIAVAFALPHCRLAPGRLALFAKGIVFAGWANTIFYWFGNASANRALSFSENTLGATNVFDTFGYLVTLNAAFVIVCFDAQMVRGFFAQVQPSAYRRGGENACPHRENHRPHRLRDAPRHIFGSRCSKPLFALNRANWRAAQSGHGR
ncbi:MAG TPA: hypothetical protein DCS39_04195 [Rhodobiaceae bacterium]|nr:hypothetical protein [Rhodobiaceae bacterium]